MLSVIKYWYQRYFTHPEAGQLFIALLLFFVLVISLSNMLAPVFFSIIIAYVLEWGTNSLVNYKCPRWIAVIIMFSLLLGILLVSLFVLIPMVVHQLNELIRALPQLTINLQQRISEWLHNSEFISSQQIATLVDGAKTHLGKLTQFLLSNSLSAIPGIITFVVYFVMVPLLVYFFLMDKKNILLWCEQFLPQQRSVLNSVWKEVNQQIGNYIRGKVLEALILAILNYITFAVFGLNYAILLALLVGLSVFVPYIGAVVSTIPIVVIGLIQFGMSSHFLWLMIIYTILFILDGTVVNAVLFSETNALHPVIVIVAILVFGGLFGFWGVFFAIPLASLFKAVMTFWPRVEVVPKSL